MKGRIAWALLLCVLAAQSVRAQFAMFPPAEALLDVRGRMGAVAAALPFGVERVANIAGGVRVAVAARDAEAAKRLLARAELDVAEVAAQESSSDYEHDGEFVAAGDVASDCGDFSGYHGYAALTACLAAIEAEYPDSVQQLDSIGQSVEGRELWRIVR